MEEDTNSERSVSQSDDQFEPAEKAMKMKKGQAKRPSSPKRAVAKQAIPQSAKKVTFDSQLSRDETERRICRLFGERYVDAIVDESFLSEQLSVRDLRVIIRLFDLMTAEQVNVRKTILIECFQNFLRTDRMKDVFYDHLSEMEKKGSIEKDKVAELKEALESQPPPAPPVRHEKPSGRATPDKSVEIAAKAEEKSSDATKTRPPGSPMRRRTPSVISGDEKSRKIMVPKFRMDPSVSVDQQLEFIKEVNEFVVNINRDLCEMERIASVIADRYAEMKDDLA